MDFRVFALLLASLSTMPATDIYLPSLPGMASQFGVEASAIKDTIALFQIGSLLSALFLGILSDRYGRKPLILISLCFFLGGSLLCTFANHFSLFVAGRVLEGMGAVGIPVVGWALVHEAYSKEQGTRIMALFGAVFAIMPLISPTLGGYIDVHFGWRWDFAGLSILCALAIPICAFAVKESLSPTLSEPLNLKSYFANCMFVLHNKTFLFYVILFAFLLIGEWCYLTLIPFYFEKSLYFGPEECGFAISIIGITYILGSMITPKLLHLFGFEKTIGLGLAASLIGAALLVAFTLSPKNVQVESAIAISVYLFGIAIIWAPSTTKSLHTLKKQKGLASSIRSLLFTFASALGSFLASVLTDRSLFPLAGILLICALLALALFKIQRYSEVRNF